MSLKQELLITLHKINALPKITLYLLKVGFMYVAFFPPEKLLEEKCVILLKCLSMDCLSNERAFYGTVANAFSI